MQPLAYIETVEKLTTLYQTIGSLKMEQRLEYLDEVMSSILSDFTRSDNLDPNLVNGDVIKDEVLNVKAKATDVKYLVSLPNGVVPVAVVYDMIRNGMPVDKVPSWRKFLEVYGSIKIPAV